MTFLPEADFSKEGSQKGPSFRWKIAEVWWKLSTILEKWKITLQDRLGGISYAEWIKTVERPAINQALGSQRKRKAAPSICFLIRCDGFSQQEVRLTTDSISHLGVDAQINIILQETIDEAGTLINTIDQIPEDWVIPVNAGDRFSADWLDMFCLALDRNAETDIVYWDEDRMDARGKRLQPFFKPDFSPELLYSLDYLESAAFRIKLLNQYRGMPGTSRAGWVFGVTRLAHRITHIPFVLQHRSTSGQLQSGIRLEQHAQRARAYLEQCGYQNVTFAVDNNNVLRLDWKVDSPLVSIIIPTKNNLAYLQRCLSSLLGKTSYPCFEILLMDDHSTDADVLAYYQEVLSWYPNLHLHANENHGPFNYSSVNNQGARLAKGDMLLFLNNDVEIIDEQWLTEMVRWAQMPGVGMVGAQLLYPDGSIQHAGIVLGMTGHAAHIYAGKPSLPAPLPASLFTSPEAVRNVSAVTGACMLARRDLFERLGGFDEQLGLVFNDVDLGVRVLRSGQRVVYAAGARLIHHEGRSRGRYIPSEDIRLGAQRLAEEIATGDRYYNPNLSLAVNWPTLVRKNEATSLTRLKQIVKFKG